MNNPHIPYILIKSYDRLEAMGIVNRFPKHYFVHRESGTCDIMIAGGMIVKDRKDLRKAIKQLEAEVASCTSLSYSIMKSGMLSLKPCQRRLENGEIDENQYAYLPISGVDKEVEVFIFPIGSEERVSYLTKGELIDNDLVTVPYKILF